MGLILKLSLSGYQLNTILMLKNLVTVLGLYRGIAEVALVLGTIELDGSVAG